MKKVLITTGGSGGHVMPSLSVYDALKDNFEVHIATDLRGSKYIDSGSYNYSIIDVPKLSTSFLLILFNLIKFCFSILKSYKYLKSKNFDILISTGGYMSLPLCLASRLLNIKIFVLEPNAVLGRANKYTLNFAEKIICYHKNLKGISQKFLSKIYLTEPILRRDVYNYQKNKKNVLDDEVKILVVGGSQGAKFFDEFISEMIVILSKTQKVKISQQVIDEKSRNYLKNLYDKNHIEHELFDFDDKLLVKAINYDLAITRSGASTISELGYLNIPFVAIPFPYATDNHQYYNAEYYYKNDSCWLIVQEEINEKKFMDLLNKIFRDNNEYFSKKKNLIQITKENTWDNNKYKLNKLLNEN